MKRTAPKAGDTYKFNKACHELTFTVLEDGSTLDNGASYLSVNVKRKKCSLGMLKSLPGWSGVYQAEILHAFCVAKGGTYSTLRDVSDLPCKFAGRLTDPALEAYKETAEGSGTGRYWMTFLQNIPSVYTKDSYAVSYQGIRKFPYLPFGTFDDGGKTVDIQDIATFQRLVVPLKDSLPINNALKTFLQQAYASNIKQDISRFNSAFALVVSKCEADQTIGCFVPKMVQLNAAGTLDNDGFCDIYYALRTALKDGDRDQMRRVGPEWQKFISTMETFTEFETDRFIQRRFRKRQWHRKK